MGRQQAFVYEMGSVTLRRCPLALLKKPLIQRILALYADYQQGLTPGGKLKSETAFYRESMALLGQLSEEASEWRRSQEEKKKK